MPDETELRAFCVRTENIRLTCNNIQSNWSRVCNVHAARGILYRGHRVSSACVLSFVVFVC